MSVLFPVPGTKTIWDVEFDFRGIGKVIDQATGKEVPFDEFAKHRNALNCWLAYERDSMAGR